MPLPKVRMFGDWDDPPERLLERLKSQTVEFDHNVYDGVEFVTDDSYDVAIVFNYLQQDQRLLTPPERSFGLVLEPPEISDWMHPLRLRKWSHGLIGDYYSFANISGYKYAPCLGFATAKPWVLGYSPSEKDDICSETSRNRACMIASNKVYTPYHQKRRAILDALLATDWNIDFYGRGMEKNEDGRVKGEIYPMGKAPTLDLYPFCIDFENSPHGVLTDKYFDPILRNTVPITNASCLLEYGVEGSYEYVDFSESVDSILERIEDILGVVDVSCYDEPLMEARRELLQGRMSLANWIVERVRCVS